MLRLLRRIGYEVGSGVMIGIPGQTYDDLANDIELFRDLNLEMIGVGPYLAAPGTPLGEFVAGNSWQEGWGNRTDRGEIFVTEDQVPATAEMTCRVIALTRLVCPDSNIPATTALATLDTESGRNHGLISGANVIMPNLTPTKYREHYAIYPGKSGMYETAEMVNAGIQRQISAIGRTVGRGPGESPAFRSRSAGK